VEQKAAVEKFFDFIRARGQGVVATTSPDGKPEAALMDLAVLPDLTIVFETTDQTRKFANLRADPRIAIVVGWVGSETLQCDGVAELTEGRALEDAQRDYFSTFPEKLAHRDWPGNHYFRVRPVWVRFSNYHPPRTVEEFRFETEAAMLPPGGWWQRLVGARRQRQHN
jgi:hypothetical protein